MLSRRDIEKELGKGINIVPVIRENFKENSINLTASKNAWTMGNGTVYWYGGTDVQMKDGPGRKSTKTFSKGNSCNGVQREHNKKLNHGLPILHKVPPK